MRIHLKLSGRVAGTIEGELCVAVCVQQDISGLSSANMQCLYPYYASALGPGCIVLITGYRTLTQTLAWMFFWLWGGCWVRES